jgi:hypothetical protein
MRAIQGKSRADAANWANDVSIYASPDLPHHLRLKVNG